MEDVYAFPKTGAFTPKPDTDIVIDNIEELRAALNVKKLTHSCWLKASHYYVLTDNFIRKYAHKLDMTLVCEYQLMSLSLIDELKDSVTWCILSLTQHFPVSFIEKHLFEFKVFGGRDFYKKYKPKEIDEIKKLFKTNIYSQKFIDKNINNLSKQAWLHISTKSLKHNFILKYKDYLNLHYVSIHSNLEVRTIRTFEKELDWDSICRYQPITKELVDTFPEKINWEIVQSAHKDIPIEVIKENHDKFNWSQIFPMLQTPLSFDLLETHKDEINWTNISYNTVIPEEFIEKYPELIGWGNILKYCKCSAIFLANNIEYFRPYITLMAAQAGLYSYYYDKFSCTEKEMLLGLFRGDLTLFSWAKLLFEN